MAPYSNEIVIWKENYFMRTTNIYEPRGPKYHCTECNEMFNTRLSILTHSKMHLKPFCVVCGVYTQNEQEMQDHMKCDHRSIVEVIPIKNTDVNQNPTPNDALQKSDKAPLRKPKSHQSRKTPFGQTRSDKHFTKCVISRFGRCINVKIPDF